MKGIIIFMINIGIVGVTGYSGVELLRILLNHPSVAKVTGSSVSFEGKLVTDIYPAFRGYADIVIVNEDTVIENSDVVFAALPHGLSEELAVKCKAKGVKLIDLGADFRLNDPKTYAIWYEKEYKYPELHRDRKSVV